MSKKRVHIFLPPNDSCIKEKITNQIIFRIQSKPFQKNWIRFFSLSQQSLEIIEYLNWENFKIFKILMPLILNLAYNYDVIMCKTWLIQLHKR